MPGGWWVNSGTGGGLTLGQVAGPLVPMSFLTPMAWPPLHSFLTSSSLIPYFWMLFIKQSYLAPGEGNRGG